MDYVWRGVCRDVPNYLWSGGPRCSNFLGRWVERFRFFCGVVDLDHNCPNLSTRGFPAPKNLPLQASLSGAHEPPRTTLLHPFPRARRSSPGPSSRQQISKGPLGPTEPHRGPRPIDISRFPSRRQNRKPNGRRKHSQSPLKRRRGEAKGAPGGPWKASRAKASRWEAHEAANGISKAPEGDQCAFFASKSSDFLL